MLKEYASVKDSGAITLTPRKKGQSALDSRWLFCVKPQPDGPWLPKARIAVQGFKQKKHYDKHEVHAPVANISTVWLLFTTANKYSLSIRQFDVKSAFLNGDLDGEEIYMEIPEGFPDEQKFVKTHVIRLQRALYGLQISPKKWYTKLQKHWNSLVWFQIPQNSASTTGYAKISL